MIPKRRKPEPLGIRGLPQIRCPAHLQWVRGHRCSIDSPSCDGNIEAAHVRTGTDGALGVKPSDIWAIPLCSHHHRHQHQIGEAAFEKQFAISMRKIADGLAAKSPHRFKWLAALAELEPHAPADRSRS